MSETSGLRVDIVTTVNCILHQKMLYLQFLELSARNQNQKRHILFTDNVIVLFSNHTKLPTKTNYINKLKRIDKQE